MLFGPVFNILPLINELNRIFGSIYFIYLHDIMSLFFENYNVIDVRAKDIYLGAIGM